MNSSKPYTISDDVVHSICRLLELKLYSNKQIADMVGVSREYVKDIKTHHRRNNISSLYNF